ncbi:MobB family relaxase [Christiangramia sp. OXR-203]|uniref:MobB family relaxase n=1 Tax=Christiangramia sp. OXR-203 TaxID=3100176 RepID=UPI002AC99EFF|nr:MobB family relaxase [Christiangramia sp. OXR-203]WPY97072.1 MobB family relaxase [Christiangramia sp. OXR-203]
MYITISAQKLGGNYSPSVADYVDYLKKENQMPEREQDQKLENFFNQYEDDISPEEVIQQIDANTSKLKKIEPKFYSITVNPSQYELRKLGDNSEALKRYTRELMKDYASCFNREINGRPISVNDIKYYAKIEHHRTFKGNDFQVKENQVYATKIIQLKNEIKKIQKGEKEGSIKKIELEINRLEKSAPHQQNGKRIVQGMLKEGNQSHIHIIVSRKDISNSVSLSPGSKYKSSEVEIKGKMIKRGFDRDAFFQTAEKTFDKNFGYQRNFVETYQARKTYIQNPKLYFSAVIGLPASEKALALKMLRESGLPMVPVIPLSKAQLTVKLIKTLQKNIGVALRSGSIGI